MSYFHHNMKIYHTVTFEDNRKVELRFATNMGEKQFVVVFIKTCNGKHRCGDVIIKDIKGKGSRLLLKGNIRFGAFYKANGDVLCNDPIEMFSRVLDCAYGLEMFKPKGSIGYVLEEHITFEVM